MPGLRSEPGGRSRLPASRPPRQQLAARTASTLRRLAANVLALTDRTPRTPMLVGELPRRRIRSDHRRQRLLLERPAAGRSTTARPAQLRPPAAGFSPSTRSQSPTGAPPVHTLTARTYAPPAEGQGPARPVPVRGKRSIRRNPSPATHSCRRRPLTASSRSDAICIAVFRCIALCSCIVLSSASGSCAVLAHSATSTAQRHRVD